MERLELRYSDQNGSDQFFSAPDYTLFSETLVP